MRFSIFTPTHSDKYLDRLAASLERQTFKDFEWVLVPNGKNPPKPSYPNLNIKVVPFINREVNSIGFLKLFACMQASGEILVEVDHDDELTPDCLEELNKAFDSETDFAYSNFCNVREDGLPMRYDEGHGWQYRPFTLDGKTYEEVLSFKPDPASVGYIWYCGNHIRAWRKSHYFSIGGHNPTLDVLDDHDLICRSYIYGNMKHLDKCLYLYHVHSENTCYSEKNARIQVETVQLYRKYIFDLCAKWSDLNGLLKIDLCGGIDKPNGWTSIDIRNGDINCDLDGPWDIKSGSVGVFRAYNALEHLKNPIHTMEEIYRCLAPNGYVLSFTPSTDSRAAWQDPTHVSYWNRNSFFYWCRASHAKYINTQARFKEMLVEDVQYEGFDRINKISFVRADLQKFDGRVPGKVYF
jgi:glycosyltransferase involved in cell wall biosynthesis